MLVKILIMKIVTFLMSPSALTRVFLIDRISPYHEVDFSSAKFGFFLSIMLIFLSIKWMKIVTISMSPCALARVFGLVLVRV